MNNFNKVRYFNDEVLGVQFPEEVTLQNQDEFKLSLDQLREELDELELAHKEGDLVGAIDALIDLDYFQKGVLYKMGLGETMYNRCFRAVHKRNMEKLPGIKPERAHYNNVVDAIKPKGWTSPEEQIKSELRKPSYLLSSDMELGRAYRFKNQDEVLIYKGFNFSGNGHWHQFEKMGEPSVIWCECLDDDLILMEEYD